MLACCLQLARGTEGTEAGPEDQAVAAAVGHAASSHLLHPSSTPSAVAAAAAAQQAHLTDALARSSSNLSSSMLGSSTPHGVGPHSPLKLRTLRGSVDSAQLGRTAGTRLSSTAGDEGSRRASSFEIRQQQGMHDMQDTSPLLASTDYGGKQPHQQQTECRDRAAAAPGLALQSPDAAGGGAGVVAGLSDASAQVDNPDQRITMDVSNYVQTSVALVLLLVRKTLNCAAFAGVQWRDCPWACLHGLCD